MLVSPKTLADERGEVFAQETASSVRRWQRRAAGDPDAMDNRLIVSSAGGFFNRFSYLRLLQFRDEM
ncbi:hypothetical protein FJ250_12070 [bacterium]|nr:hypothetical protein [bacterium]